MTIVLSRVIDKVLAIKPALCLNFDRLKCSLHTIGGRRIQGDKSHIGKFLQGKKTHEGFTRCCDDMKVALLEGFKSELWPMPPALHPNDEGRIPEPIVTNVKYRWRAEE